jgi:hypothetical protein
LLGTSLAAAASPVNIEVQYFKTGKENPEEASRLGLIEINEGNPCLLALRREIMAWTKTKTASDAIEEVKKREDLKLSDIRLVLRASNGSLELLLESRTGIYRAGVVLNSVPGSWKTRMKSGQCSFSNKQKKGFLNQLNEPTLLARCIRRKLRLIDAASPIAVAINIYVPLEKIREARVRLRERSKIFGNLLREKKEIYLTENRNLASCQKGLRLLESESAATVAVLKEIATHSTIDESLSSRLERLEETIRETEPNSSFLTP